jgi:hypothetical protein
MEFIHQLQSNVTLRKCSYCRQPNHRIGRCHVAYADGKSLHRTIISIIQANFMHQDTLDAADAAIQIFLNHLSLSKLKVIALIHQGLNVFASNLYNNFLITLSQTSMNTKRDLLVVLNYYYQQISINYLLSFREDIEEPLQDVANILPRKFNIDTQILLSDKESMFECPICIDKVEDSKRITSNCNHDVCNSCFDNYLSTLQSSNNLKTPSCCLCRSNITTLAFTDVEYCNIIKTKFLN